MFLMLKFTIILAMILMIILKIIPILSIHKHTDREITSPFECGFDPFSSSRMSFSIHFFSISLMFLIFDIEITLILPVPMITKLLQSSNWIYFTHVMIILLILGLMLEWKEGSMEWKN